MWKGCSIKRCICISYSNPIHPKCANIPQKTKFNRFHYKWTCEFCLQRSCHSHYCNISKKLISVWLQHKVTLVWEVTKNSIWKNYKNNAHISAYDISAGNWWYPRLISKLQIPGYYQEKWLNPLSAHFTTWSNTPKQLVGKSSPNFKSKTNSK